MIVDAIGEVQTEINGQNGGLNEEEEEISEEDMKYLKNCLKLFKLVRMLFLKISKGIVERKNNNLSHNNIVHEEVIWTDNIVKSADTCSVQIDELACSLELPLDLEVTRKIASEVINLSQNLVEVALKAETDSSRRWFETLKTQLIQLKNDFKIID
ncbi:hypothetical protein HK096_010568 [Nowakowskiella sp. JEL0078]|nr:hypothetical protein HK096_010568 [Nowakowskiella sp. JEL0078]